MGMQMLQQQQQQQMMQMQMMQQQQAAMMRAAAQAQRAGMAAPGMVGGGIGQPLQRVAPTSSKASSVRSEIAELKREVQVEDASPSDFYDFVCKLGEGAFGSVYKAVEKATGNVFAIKVINLEENNSHVLIRKELETLRACDSQYIVRYVKTYMCGSDLYIVMEFAECGSAWDMMFQGKIEFSEEEIAAVCSDIVHGLAYLHSLRTIHRDVKAGNVLLTRDGRAKLADFGVCAQLESSLSRRQTVVGSPYWLAPEVVQESGYDVSADIWSLGITAIELAQKIPPHSKTPAMRVIFLIPKLNPPTFDEPAKWSPEFNDFVTKVLQKDPSRRPSAKDLLSHPFIKAGRKNSQAVLRRLIDTKWGSAEHQAQKTVQTMAGPSTPVQVNTPTRGDGTPAKTIGTPVRVVVPGMFGSPAGSAGGSPFMNVVPVHPHIQHLQQQAQMLSPQKSPKPSTPSKFSNLNDTLQRMQSPATQAASPGAVSFLDAAVWESDMGEYATKDEIVSLGEKLDDVYARQISEMQDKYARRKAVIEEAIAQWGKPAS